MERDRVVARVRDWYLRHARDLPWRRPGTSPWGVLVSEVMLQQTPVSRVVGPWTAWLQRWPTPAGLAAEPAGEAVRAWGRLGYPRRARRLHLAAQVIVERHAGEVPAETDDLAALPGVGTYTAAAVAAFAYCRRTVVLDTNVRRVLTRLEAGEEFPPTTLTKAERERAEAWLPEPADAAAAWSVAAMELGAQLCTAASPRCDSCPAVSDCTWFARQRPAWTGPPRRVQAYEGTDRQCRGRLLAALRETTSPLSRQTLLAYWPAHPEQAGRALDSLLADGLVRPAPDGGYLL